MQEYRTEKKILESIEALLTDNELQTSKIEFEEPETKEMYKRLFSLLGLNIALFILAGFLHSLNSQFFSLSLGFFLSSTMITFLFILDWIIIPYDTFKTISKHPVALSILLFTITISVCFGVGVGDDYHPAQQTNERNPQYNNSNSNRGAVSTAPSDNGIELRRNSGGSEGEQQGYPNR